ncbi:MAG: DNA repair protein RecO [Pseudomonadota bacterium]|nr:DNA repair protein RecO [Pseudomonadota bacterium]
MANTDLGYLLHSRPYRDSSVIGDFLLQHHGRISLLYKGVRKAGKQGAKGRLLQPFSPLAVGFDGRNELKSGRLLEAAGPSVFLVGAQLYSGLYVNELLVRLLHREEASPPLFAFYQQVIQALRTEPIEPILRRFERQLLAELGYELTLLWDAEGEAIRSQQHYLYVPDQGFLPTSPLTLEQPLRTRCFSGEHLLAIERHAYHDSEVAQAAKRLSRLALAPHLGDKPLHSRELFKQLSP